MNSTQKIDIRSLSVEILKQHFSELGQPAFRAKQVYDWLWGKACTNFEEMSNLPKSLREKLGET